MEEYEFCIQRTVKLCNPCTGEYIEVPTPCDAEEFIEQGFFEVFSEEDCEQAIREEEMIRNKYRYEPNNNTLMVETGMEDYTLSLLTLFSLL